MKSDRKSNRMALRVALAGVALGIVCLPAWAAKPTTAPASQAGKFTIGRDTTYITGPLNADGTINYVQAYNDTFGKGVTAENNAAVLILRAAGPSAIQEPFRGKLLKALGMADLPEKGDYLTSLPSASDSPDFERNILRSDRALSQPADPKEDANIFQWVKANEKPLELFIAASKRSRYFVPRFSNENPPTMLDGLFPMSLATVRSACKALVTRAMIRANQGDFGGAQSDLAAVHRLARLVAQSPGLIDYLVAIACDTIACRAEQGISFRVKMTPQQARGLLAATAAIPALPPPIVQLDQGERWFNLDLTMLMMREGYEKFLDRTRLRIDGQEKTKLPRFELDFDEYLRVVNRDFDQLVQAAALKTYAQRNYAINQLANNRFTEVKEVQAQTSSQEFIFPDARKQLILLVEKIGTADKKKLTQAIAQLNSVSSDSMITTRLFAMAQAARANRTLGVVSLAIAAYRADNGRLPQSLDVLAPKCLTKVPVDPFTDAPLKYRLTDKGFLLYSVGPNMKDDDGQFDGPAPGGPEGKDDVAVRAE